MIRLELKETDNVLEAISKIKGLSDLNVELIIPEGSILFENYLNLKLIQTEADKMEKSVEFYTEDEIGNNLIMALNGKPSDLIAQTSLVDETPKAQELKRKITLPKIAIPKLNIKVPDFIKARKGALILGLIMLMFIISFVVYGMTAPKVIAKISVHSQSLTRSVTVRVKSGATTDITAKILKGSVLSSTIDITKEIDTTGTKIIGDKASGKVTIYNYTSDEVTIDKNTKMTYQGKSTDLIYYLKDSVTIPASSTPAPGDSRVPTQSSGDITASDIGESYNISGDKTLVVKGYSKDNVVGKTKDDITGGKSQTVKIVAAADITNLSKAAVADAGSQATRDISNKLANNQKLVTGSVLVKITKETFNKIVGDQTDKLSLTQSVSADGLIYFDSELNTFLDEYVKDLIPAGFVLSSQNREVNVEVLGNSASSVLTSTEADIQVTLKTLVVPDIQEETIKKELIGKTPAEAEKILGSIKNVNSYEFKLSPAIPFFRKIPNDLNRITLTIERN